jgi:hypothetical protein
MIHDAHGFLPLPTSVANQASAPGCAAAGRSRVVGPKRLPQVTGGAVGGAVGGGVLSGQACHKHGGAASVCQGSAGKSGHCSQAHSTAITRVHVVQMPAERLQHSSDAQLAAHSMAAPAALAAADPPCSGSRMRASRTPLRSWRCTPPPASWPRSCRWCSCSWRTLACSRSCCCQRTAGTDGAMNSAAGNAHQLGLHTYHAPLHAALVTEHSTHTVPRQPLMKQPEGGDQRIHHASCSVA